MPFKKLQEATQSGSGNGLKYCLDSFSVNARVAPSISSAVINLQNLQSMSLIDTMLSEEAFMIILGEHFEHRRSLKSLNLSQNEHLTPKCYT